MSNNFKYKNMDNSDKKENRKFVSLKGVSKYLFCSICTEIFFSPVRIKECGHTFCKECLKKWTNYNSQCPLCRNKFKIKNTKKDFIAFNIINDMEVFCNNLNCPWKGKLSEYSKHLKQCNFNPLKMSDSIKNIIYSNKRSLSCDDIGKKNNITTQINNKSDLNNKTTENSKENTCQNKNPDKTSDDEEENIIDKLTSFNTRVNLKARLFNRNKDLLNKVLISSKIGAKSKSSDFNIFNIINENHLDVK